MRFKRNIIQPDPPIEDGALPLPDDLAALGEHLQDDAARLAKVYPADFYDRLLQSELPSTEAAATQHDDGFVIPSFNRVPDGPRGRGANQHNNGYAVPPVKSGRTARKLASFAVASVVFLLLGAPLSIYWMVRQMESDPAGNEATESHRAAEGIPNDSNPLQSGSSLMVTGSSPVSSDPQAMFLHKVSGPELDAWLDVIEQSEPETATLSM